MKLIKIIDVTMQAMFLVTAIVLCVESPDPIPTIMGIQWIMGPWQLTSSVWAHFVDDGHVRRLKRYHLVISGLYLLSIPLVFFYSDHRIALTYLTVPAWALALFYFYCCLLEVRKRSHKGNFLRHLSF